MEDASVEQAQGSLYFVGVAASAGGLEAASSLVQNLPRRANAVYILAQHMSPTHKSLLTSLISRETDLPVKELTDATEPEADTVYVTPPNSDVIFENGRLHLRDPAGHAATPKPSADRLLKSLAEQCGERCVAIILSGTGSDGSYGVQAVREAGGITIAQDAPSAKYDGMPTSAVETGCVDLTLTPEQIGQHLQKILASPRNLDDLRNMNVIHSRLTDLLQLLLVRTQVDFRDYKETTVNRRISRRMVALGINDYDEYVEFCRNSDVEVEELHRDLLISVTRFFRDPNHFEQLRKSLESAISKHESRQFRVWVAGCATGEEAYSIAILIAEAMGGVDELTKRNVQIFASDIDDRALEIGRRAIYPGSAAADIPKPYLDRYFDLSGANIQVRQELRNVVLFSHHNVAQDPPFINVDLISLRNVLIYFNTGLQERVLRRVHYALAPKGMLFLGTSEAFGSMRSYFEMISHTDKLYRKREVRTSPIMNFADPKAAFSARAVGSGTALQKREDPTPDMQLFESLARSVAPNGFIVTRAGEIVRVLGDISNVIELSEKSALDLSTRILGPGMRDEANSMINVTLKTGEARTGRWHSLKGATAQRVRLRAYPILNAFGGEDNVLFSLEYGTEPKEPRSLDQLNEEDRTKYVRQIEQEMQTTRETLQQTVEELQTSNEELQSVNEELQSTNEELQATNEELETSNEELQSTNEELITVNEEMQVNSSELQRLTIELSGVVKSSPYTVLVMDQALLIRRVSDRAKVFFNLGDLPPTGLHLAQISATEGFQALPALCSDALRERSPKSLYVETGGRSYSILAGPFSGAHDSVVGLKLTIIEVDVSAYATMASVMEELGGVGHWRVNLMNNKLYWSPQVFRIHGLEIADDAPTLDDAISYYHVDDQDRVREAVTAAIEEEIPFSFEARLNAVDGRIVPVQAAGQVVLDAEKKPVAMVGAIVDLSTILRDRMLVKQFEDVQALLDIGFYSFDVHNNRPYWSRSLYRMLGFDPDTHTPTVESAVEVFHPEDRERIAGYVSQAIAAGEGFHYEARLLRSDGEVLPCEGHGSTLPGPDGHTAFVYGFFRLINK